MDVNKEDKPYPSFFVLGFIDKKPLHLVLAINSESKETILITVYQPIPNEWSAEKAIKSVLNFLRIPFPLVHELGTLVALLPDDKMPPGDFDLAVLNPYASVLRYEEPNAELTYEEVSASLEAIEDVLKWAKEIIR